MASQMHQLPAVEARIAQYFVQDSFRVLGPMVAEHLATGGKRLRARLALEATELLGGSDREGQVAWAAACELMHNATLVHDDLQDGDTVRRGAPALWVAHGAAQAINAGDAMLLAPLALLHEAPIPAPLQLALCRALVAGMLQVIEGQAAECAMTAKGEGTPEAYTSMVRGKTAALFMLPVMGAALVAGLDFHEASAIAHSFVPIGELFQLQDDVLDLWGDKGRGLVGSDVYEGKVSALVVHHMKACPQDRTWLTELLRRSRASTTAHEVHEARARFVASGARRSVVARIHALAAEAQQNVHPKLLAMQNALIAQVLAPIAHVASDKAAS